MARAWVQVAWILGGYALAVAIAAGAVAFRIALTQGADAQASSGMYAFGDLVLFLAVFAVLALAPTAGALAILRRWRPFWLGLAGLALAVASTGVIAVLLYAPDRTAANAAPLTVWAPIAALRILAAPILLAADLLAAFLAPERKLRAVLLLSSAVEAALTAFAALTWLLPGLLP